MPNLADKIAELERRRDSLRQEAYELFAEASGLEVQIEALRSGVQAHRPAGELSLADAVEQVLRESGRSMSPRDIHAALLEVGRSDPPGSIGGTLQYLKQRGRVVSPRRSRWTTPTP